MNKEVVNLKLLSTKAQSKVELYRLFKVDCSLFLPPQREASVYFIRDIMEGYKRVLLK